MDIEEIKRKVLEELKEKGGGGLDEVNEILSRQMEARNNRPLDNFEGYSPEEMNHILYDPLGKESPLQMKKLKAEDYRRIPILNQVKYLINRIAEEGEMKLTSRGYLPVKLVKDIYDQGFMTDFSIEEFDKTLRKELDSKTVHLGKIIAEISGLTKKRRGKISLTKKGERFRTDDFKLLKTIWRCFTVEFNWQYFDRYSSPEIGPRGYAFSLILVSKYGDTKHEANFFSKKYFDAFPQMIEMVEFNPEFFSQKEVAFSCYEVRTFSRFMDFFGLVKVEENETRFNQPCIVKKKPLFDLLFKIRPPKAKSSIH